MAREWNQMIGKTAGRLKPKLRVLCSDCRDEPIPALLQHSPALHAEWEAEPSGCLVLKQKFQKECGHAGSADSGGGLQCLAYVQQQWALPFLLRALLPAWSSGTGSPPELSWHLRVLERRTDHTRGPVRLKELTPVHLCLNIRRLSHPSLQSRDRY